MPLLLALLIVAVVIAIVYWLLTTLPLPLPPQLVFLRWLIPLILILGALIWLWPKVGIT